MRKKRVENEQKLIKMVKIDIKREKKREKTAKKRKKTHYCGGKFPWLGVLRIFY
jgi:hypothetical protein